MASYICHLNVINSLLSKPRFRAAQAFSRRPQQVLELKETST